MLTDGKARREVVIPKGRRESVNLAAVDVFEIRRGDVNVYCGSCFPSQRHAPEVRDFVAGNL